MRLRFAVRHGLPARLSLLVCVAVFMALSQRVLADTDVEPSKQDEKVYILDRPESQLAGLLNTELTPANSFQTDLTLGHVWYGIDDNTNVFTNIFADLGALIGSPALSIGAKRKFCERESVRCSILGEVVYGFDLGSEPSRFFGLLLQNSYSYDLDESGRIYFGLGSLSYSERGYDSNASKFADNFLSWINFSYDYAFISEWSLGAGFASSLGGLFQQDFGSIMRSSRIAAGASRLFFARTQYSFGEWVLSGGGALLTQSSGPSLWPVFEIHYRSF